MQDGHVVQERSGEVGQGPVGAQPLLGSSMCWGLWGNAVLSPGQEVVCWSPQSPAHHHPKTSGRPLCKPRGQGLVQGLQGCPWRAAGAHPVVSVAAFAGDMKQNGQGARKLRGWCHQSQHLLLPPHLRKLLPPCALPFHPTTCPTGWPRWHRDVHASDVLTSPPCPWTGFSSPPAPCFGSSDCLSLQCPPPWSQGSGAGEELGFSCLLLQDKVTL